MIVLPFILITYLTKGCWFKRDISYLVFALALLLIFDLPSILQSQTPREFRLQFFLDVCHCNPAPSSMQWGKRK